MVKKYKEHPISWYLYQSSEIKGEVITPKLLQDFLSDSDPIEFFCPICKTDSLLKTRISNQEITLHSSDRSSIVEAIYNVSGTCQRGGHRPFYYIFLFSGNKIRKIGQVPSAADFDQADYKKFSKILPENYLNDLSRASGLAAHSIGIGSFIYLRRVFEYIIEESHKLASQKPDFKEDQYSRSRMSEKINLLKDELPTFIVENAEIYAILSKTVHELSEEEALKYFPILKSSTEYILEESLEKELLKQKKGELSKLIKDVHQEITKQK